MTLVPQITVMDKGVLQKLGKLQRVVFLTVCLLVC